MGKKLNLNFTLKYQNIGDNKNNLQKKKKKHPMTNLDIDGKYEWKGFMIFSIFQNQKKTGCSKKKRTNKKKLKKFRYTPSDNWYFFCDEA